MKILLILIMINVCNAQTIFCKGDMLCMNFMTRCTIKESDCKLIYDFCKRGIDPRFNKNMCLRDIEECMSISGDYEWCTDYWEE